jgi:hypothetical protein
MRSEGSVGWRLPLTSAGMLQKPWWLAESCGGLLDSGFAVLGVRQCHVQVGFGGNVWSPHVVPACRLRVENGPKGLAEMPHLIPHGFTNNAKCPIHLRLTQREFSTAVRLKQLGGDSAVVCLPT